MTGPSRRVTTQGSEFHNSMPSIVENCIPLTKQLQSCVLRVLSHRTPSDQATRIARMSWDLSDQYVIRWCEPSTNDRMMQVAHPGSSISRAGEHKQAVQGGSHLCHPLVFFSTSFSLSSYMAPYDQLTGEKSPLWIMNVSAWYVCQLKRDGSWTTMHSGVAENSSNGRD